MIPFCKVFKNTLDKRSISVLLIVYTLISVINFRHNGYDFRSDYGREVYISQQVAQGKVLYKDIINIFGPLSYQFNAAVFIIFGQNLIMLEIITIINGFITVILFYKISRYLNPPGTSLVFSLFYLLLYIGVGNFYVSPYSFAITYATTVIYASVLCLLSYCKTHKTWQLYLAYFFFGISVTLKYEHVLFMLVLLFITIKFSRNSFKNWVYSVFSFISVPIFSLAVLAIQGLGVADLVNHTYFLYRYATSQSLQTLYRNVASLTPQLSTLAYQTTMLLIFVIYIYSFLQVRAKLRNFKEQPCRIKIEGLLQLLIYTCLVIFLGMLQLRLYRALFSFLPLFCIFLLISKKYQSYFSDKSELNFLLILGSAVTLSIKGVFYLPLFPYGIFLGPLLMLTALSFVDRWMQHKHPITSLPSDSTKQTYYISLLVLSVSTFLCVEYSLFSRSKSELVSAHGKIYVSRSTKASLGNALSYIHVSIPKEEQILVIPEGHIVNFLSDHSTDNNLCFMFMPPYMEAYGEDNLIRQLSEKKIKHILLLDRRLNEYFRQRGLLISDTPDDTFGETYGRETYDYITRNYNIEKRFGKYDEVTLYSL